MATNSPGHNRGIRRKPAVVNAVLGVGDHVFSLPGNQGALFAQVDQLATAGTANLFFTFDDRPLADLHTAGTFNADVPSTAWFPGATGNSVSGISGAPTAVMVTVAADDVHVIIRARDRSLGSHGA